ncbi:tetratricopeptide repeat protein [Brucella pseudogrignonensis]|uniref:tetratricopeptide repeat protein n=1 Tax=Brucella pseudogrignonensis TaxID=419475 RepID=UPI000DE571B5|nr:tetratricopeptide repeat protein [Brucella pseudogrignonensis]KAB2686985.1 tetratricopeptide repeat protein [Brucella pseudogrignonensis]
MMKIMRMRNVFAYLNNSSLLVTLGLSALISASSAYAETKPSLTAPITPVQVGTDSDQKPAPKEQNQAEQTPEERLDKLFADLKRTSDETKARRLTVQINQIWSQSGSATIDLLIQWASAAMLEKRYTSALDFLNEAIALNPDYAEAWNRRATVYFLRNDYAHAMYDINRTLELEPRHYGALTGMAEILRARGLKEQALKAYEQALQINPMMRDAQKSLLDLTEELSDTRT